MIEVLGDVGGVVEIILVFFSFLIVPISTHSFYIKAINKFFVAYTKDSKIFKAKNLWTKLGMKKNIDINNSDNYKIIKFHVWDSFRIFIQERIPICCECIWKKKKNLINLYNRG